MEETKKVSPPHLRTLSRSSPSWFKRTTVKTKARKKAKFVKRMKKSGSSSWIKNRFSVRACGRAENNLRQANKL